MADDFCKITLQLPLRLRTYDTLLAEGARLMEDGGRQMVKGSALRYAETAAKNTPPDMGKKKIARKWLTRAESRINLKDPATWAEKGRFHFYRKKFYHDQTPFALWKGGKFVWYADKSAWQADMAVRGRGAGRYGFMQAMPVLGKPVYPVVPGNWKFAGMYSRLTAQGKVGRTRVENNGLRISVENNAQFISSYALQYASSRALGLVNLGLRQMIRRLDRQIEAVPF